MLDPRDPLQLPVTQRHRWHFAAFEVDERRRELLVAGKAVHVEARVLELLLLLLRHAGEVVTKDEILEAVWPGREVTEASLTKCVSRLRQVLGDDEQAIVRTVHGFGYRLVAEVVFEARPAARATTAPGRLCAGGTIEGRPGWRLVHCLGVGSHGEAWLGEQPKSGERRVFKFSRDGSQLAALKREITLHRLLSSCAGPRDDRVQVLDWNLEGTPGFIELEWCGLGNLPEWATPLLAAGELPLAQRLALAVGIADALAAAHSIGVLHKDLKPSNILMSRGVDGMVRPKLADFGCGALLDPSQLDVLGITRLGFTRAANDDIASGGTPAYLAPELMAGGLPSLRSDVYALGVILYQLVVGDFRRPLAPGWEQEVGDELLREDIAAAAAGDPARRLGDAAQLSKSLRALEARRAERARQRAALEEVERAKRQLEHVRARRGLWLALAGTLATGFVATTLLAFGASRAQREALAQAEAARAVTAFLTRDVLAAADPMASGVRDVRLHPLLDGAAAHIEQRFADQPVVLAEVQGAMGAGYAALFDTQRAEQMLRAAERGLSGRIDEADMRLHDVRMALWNLYVANLDFAKLLAVSQRMAAAEQRAGRSGSNADDKAHLMIGWVPCAARAPIFLGMSDCRSVVRPFYERARARFGADDPRTREMQFFWAVSLLAAAHEDEAELLLRELCPAMARHLGPRHRVDTCRRLHGAALDAIGRPAEAVPMLEEVVDHFDRALGATSPLTTVAEYNLAGSLLHAGEPVRAAQVARRGIEGLEQNHDDGVRLQTQMVLAQALVKTGQAHEAIALGRATLAETEQRFGPANALALRMRQLLLPVYLDAGEGTQGEALAKINLGFGRRLPDAPPWLAGQLESELAQASFRGATSAAAPGARQLLSEASAVLARERGAGNPRKAAATRTLARR